MTEPDIIRVRGVEYEACPHWVPGNSRCPPCPDDWHGVECIRPKRVQTGWVCRKCKHEGVCVFLTRDGGSMGDNAPHCAVLEPFYGGVVE